MPESTAFRGGNDWHSYSYPPPASPERLAMAGRLNPAPSCLAVAGGHQGGGSCLGEFEIPAFQRGEFHLD